MKRTQGQCHVSVGLDNDKPTWRKFRRLCRREGKRAAAVLREFIHEYLAHAAKGGRA